MKHFENRASVAEASAEKLGPLSRLLQELAQTTGDEFAEAWTTELAPGDRIGRFEIRSEIGRGGFGVVYEALDPELGRSVALKTLRPGRSRRDLTQDWIRREAEAVARLDHPAIVTIFDVGASAGGPYLVEELLRGETLAERLARGPLPADEALRVAEEIARGLAHAHERGVLHRDLKPANVFLCDDGRVKLLDFGLAHLLGTQGSSGGGTPAYMAPEQARGEAVDERADVYAAATVLGEMLTGARPTSLTVPRGIPKPLWRAVAGGLTPDREGRSRDGAAWRQTLVAARRAMGRPRLARRIAFVSGIGLVIVGWFVYRDSRIRWALQVALPRAAELAESTRYEEAFALAREVERVVPDDPRLLKLWPETSSLWTIETTPPGARVLVKRYSRPDEPWRHLGASPVSGVRLPLAHYRWRAEREGFASVERSGGQAVYVSEGETVILKITLPDPATTPPTMVRVTGGRQKPLFPALRHLPRVLLGDFLIDRHEVTNQDFKRFVDAGGYENRALWREEFVQDGRVLSRTEAMDAFRDRTGRPGPSTWQSGTYDEGQDQLPVTGVSWYEAAAYARFVGKSLPTVYQWNRAAGAPMAHEIVPLSNFGGGGLAPVGRFQGMGQYGAYDMAGNAKEWCWNESRGKRYVLGGAWDEPRYTFLDADAQSPFLRAPNVGFRLVKSLDDKTAPEATAPIPLVVRDFTRERPVTPEVARAFARIYDYDRGPLQARVEEVTDGASGWRREKVSFAAAYGGERVVAYLFTPRGFSPPHQTVVIFPGSDALFWRSSAKMDEDVVTFAGLLRAGRAVLYPVYKSTYERGDGITTDLPSATTAYRDHVVMWTKDLRRSLDYIETRPDLDPDRVALYGLSWGAVLGPLLAAVEDRIRVALLVAGGLVPQACLPEADPYNFAPLVRQPTLMVNGQNDFFYPLETSQRPLFQILGSADKRHAILDSGHLPPLDVVGAEMNTWMDQHLGPVR